jgi:hypothetical protein
MGGIGYFSRYRVSRKQIIYADIRGRVGCTCVCASFIHVLSDMASKSVKTHTGTSSCFLNAACPQISTGVGVPYAHITTCLAAHRFWSFPI